MLRKILIVDDSMTTLEMMKAFFEKKRLEVIVAGTGESAVEKTLAERPDLVVVDTLLPGADGFETCRQIKAKTAPNSPKVIIHTGNIDAIDAVKAEDAGADEYCVKTTGYESLLEGIKNVYGDDL